MTWINNGQNRDATLATLPAIGTAFGQLYSSFYQQPYIGNETLEICRLRLAQLHNSPVDLQRQDCPIDQVKRAQLSNWSSDPHYCAAERACLELTEVYAMDAQAITDAQADAVKQHHGDKGLLVLIQALGIFDAMARLSLLWQLSASNQA